LRQVSKPAIHAAAMKVLLARPHDFIVEHMRRAVTAAGHEPVALKSLEQLDAVPVADVCGVVVSLAASSVVPASPAVVVSALRKRWPTAPLVMTGLSALASARAGLEPALQHLQLRDLESGELPPGAVLYLTDVNLKQAFEASVDALRRHFGR
jgi:hypothetical protein